MSNEFTNQDQNLLVHLLREISLNRDVYPLLQNNLDKLNENFALLLRTWSTKQFVQQEPARVINIAKIILKFSQLIQSFEQGDLASNLEIAIAGYEIALQVFNREAFPNDWDTIQQCLLIAYQQRQNILYRIIAEVKREMYQTQSQINILSEQLPQELQQVKLQLDEYKNQAITQQIQQTKQEVYQLKTELTKLCEADKSHTEINLQPIVSAIKEIKFPSQCFNTVILYDIENLTMGNREPNFNFSLRSIINQIEEINAVDKIALQRAYADWSNHRLRAIRADIQRLGIEPVQIFGFSCQRNAADIQLTIDAIELAHNKNLLQIFVIISGDGAFASLAKKLHEYGKTVIGCAYRNQANNILAAVCDYFIWIPNPQEEDREDAINWVGSTTISEPEKIATITDAQTVLNYLKTNEPYCSLLGQNGLVLSVVRTIFTDLISGFDYKLQGFTKFKDYLASVCQNTEFEIVFHNGDRTKTMLKIKHSELSKRN